MRARTPGRRMRRQACVVRRVQYSTSAAWLCAYRAMRRRARAGWDEGRPRVRVQRPEFICDQEEERAAAERGLVRFQRGVSALRTKRLRVPGGPLEQYTRRDPPGHAHK